jgi:hypothetical protein
MQIKLKIRDSHRGEYGKGQAFQRNISPPSSGAKSMPMKKAEVGGTLNWFTVT